VITNGLNVASGTNPPPQLGPSGGELVQSPSPPSPTGGWKAEFTYDGLGRLRIRRDYYAYSSGFYLTNTTLYIYDGNRVIQERNAGDVPTVSYTRGTDLSGSLEGAGGIGGLLARSSGYSSGNWTSHAYYHADGKGNITTLVDGSQAVVASYRYDPYGNMLSKSGTLADANLYRFSSKEFHVNSGLYYYLYRFYAPDLQRWLNRDPIGELGGQNLYGFVLNRPTMGYDVYGLIGTPCQAAQIELAELRMAMNLEGDETGHVRKDTLNAVKAAEKKVRDNCPDPPTPQSPLPGPPYPVPVLVPPTFDPTTLCQYNAPSLPPPTQPPTAPPPPSIPMPTPGQIATGVGVGSIIGIIGGILYYGWPVFVL